MTRDYTPFGEALVATGSNENNFQYSQKELDSDIGLYYFGARYYNPALGRWYVPDPAGQGFSPYTYCGNNPLIMVDPDGEVFWLVPFLISGAINVGVDALTEFAIAQATGQEFKYSWKQGLTSFAQGVVFSGVSHVASINKLGNFAYKLATKPGPLWSIGRGLAASAINQSIQVASDGITKENMDAEYWNNMGIQFGIQTASLSFNDVLNDAARVKPEHSIEKITKKEQKALEKAVTQEKLEIKTYDSFLSIHVSGKLNHITKMAVRDLNTAFYKDMATRVSINAVSVSFAKYVGQPYLQKQSLKGNQTSPMKPYGYYGTIKY